MASNRILLPPNPLAEASVKWRKENAGTFKGMFSDGPDSVLSLVSDVGGCRFDGSESIKDFSEMFKGRKELSAAPLFDTGKGEDFSRMFAGCAKLKEVPAYDLKNAKSLSGMVEGCDSLIGFRCKNISCNLDLSHCPKLGKEALAEVISNLKESEGNVLRLGEDNLKKLSQEDIDKAREKGWALC